MSPELELLEEWLPIIGYEGWYEVSNLGRVRSLPRKVPAKLGSLASRPGVLLRAALKRDGYPFVRLSKNGKNRVYLVHVLVAEAFIGPRAPLYELDHKNGNKMDNAVGNLEYVTRSENMRRAFAMGLVKLADQRGEKHSHAKLTRSDVIEIRRLCLEGMTQKAVASQFGVSKGTISDAICRRTWDY